MTALSQSYTHHFIETLRLSTPVIIAQLGLVMMGVIDNIMIGDIGYHFLSAASLANSIFFILTVIGIGITFAISPLVAEASAAGRDAQCGLYLRQGVWVGIGSGLFIALLIAITTFFLPLMGQPEQDVALATPYLHIINLSVLPMMLFQVFKQFSDGLELTRPAMVITLIALAFNVVANYILIYGWGIIPALELNGAGIGTFMSRTLMMILMIAYVSMNKRFQRYGVRMRWREFSWTTIRKIYSIGLPSGLQLFFEVGAFGGAVIMIGWIGPEQRSAHQIAINMASISYMFVTGIAAGATIRVGAALGRKDFREMRLAGTTGLVLGAGFMLVAAGIFVLGKDWLPTLYVSEEQVLSIAARLVLLAALFQLFDGIQAVAIGILRGIQDVNVPTVIAFISYWLIGLPVGYVLAFEAGMGVDGVWWGFVVCLTIAAIALTYRFIRKTQHLQGFPPTPPDAQEEQKLEEALP
ncbi:MAG: MATE family efflux transporter [Bacteroidota bacterium]